MHGCEFVIKLLIVVIAEKGIVRDKWLLQCMAKQMIKCNTLLISIVCVQLIRCYFIVDDTSGTSVDLLTKKRLHCIIWEAAAKAFEVSLLCDKSNNNNTYPTSHVEGKHC